MLKVVAGLVAGVVGFMAGFGFVTRDEIAAEVAVELDEGFVGQCVARLGPSLPNPSRAADVCGCMKADFDARGYALTDAFGEHLPQMREITQACASLYM